MSNLTLPFFQSGSSNTLAGGDGGNAFAITLTDGGGTAISATSFGTDSQGDTATGVYAETDVGIGVMGVATSSSDGQGYPTGVQGVANGGVGVFGSNEISPIPVDQPAGVVGGSLGHYGVFGSSGGADGVKGVSASSQHAGVSAVNDSGGYGLWARGTPAVYATSNTADAVVGTSASPQNAGVSANNTSRQTGTVPSGFALWASSNNTAVYARGAPAGYFEGDVQVTGDVILINSDSADVAEDFDVEGDSECEPGTVLVIGPDGRLLACDAAYDTRVAGVVSGAGDLRPAMVLQRVPAKSPSVIVDQT